MIRSIFIGIYFVFMTACTTFHKQLADHRVAYKTDFLTDPRSPLQKDDLKNLRFYPPNPKALVKSRFRMTPEAEPFDLPTYSGITRSYRKWGEAKFLWDKDSVTISMYENLTLLPNPLYKDYLFLPFRDITNGGATYGGGRYLNMSKKDAEDGWITIDFNKSYNPWCAYSDGFNCPIPPEENHLPFPVHAGEKHYRGEVKH